MTRLHGWNGQILRVDLPSGKISVEKPETNFYRRCFGGWGFIAYYLLKELKPGVDPLGPENKLIFATGVITASRVPSSARNSVGAKSPLTGGFGGAETGGFWGGRAEARWVRRRHNRGQSGEISLLMDS